MPVNKFSLTVMGSSVPNGQGAEIGKGYAHLFCEWLKNKSSNRWSTGNISIGGNNTTDILNRWYADLLPQNSHYVYYGLSLGNEGVHEHGEMAFISYRSNMDSIIRRTRNFNKVPIIGNNYPRGDFNEADYTYIKRMNLLMHEWDVPTVNLLGAIDNGSGQWADGYVADNAHPNTAGHAEMFYAIVPSLPDALAANKPQPKRIMDTSLEFSDKLKMRLTWIPENIVHSFTLSFSFKTFSTGIAASFRNSDKSTSILKIDTDGRLIYKTAETGTEILVSSTALNDGKWHTATLTHYHAWGRTFLYIDGVTIDACGLIEKLNPEQFYLNDFNAPAEEIIFRELFFYRSAMSFEEINALYSGRMLKSSLELYAPLYGNKNSSDDVLENMAQSLNILKIELEKNAQCNN